ncbi:hypothetical protein BDF19DRAFT_450052 [Syncephalis fuscata]|nr:hypothetical protein BDF19DRAFT_450052 [Syncephalis fuscata]
MTSTLLPSAIAVGGLAGGDTSPTSATATSPTGSSNAPMSVALGRSSSSHSLPSRAGQTTFRRDHFQFLPRLAQILDLIASGGSAIEVAKATTELNDSFQRCLQTLDALPGADLTREDQQQRLAERTAELAQKRQQLDTYAKLATLHWSISASDVEIPTISNELDTSSNLQVATDIPIANMDTFASEPIHETVDDLDPIISIMDEDDDISI